MSMRIGAVVVAVIVGVAPAVDTLRAAQPAGGVLEGHAARAAKKPYTQYSVRARNVELGRISDTVTLDSDARFSLSTLQVPGQYLLELYDDKHTRVVCTEGPFELTEVAPQVGDIVFDCGNAPAGWVLLAAAAAAGVTAVASVAATGDANSPVIPASAAR